MQALLIIDVQRGAFDGVRAPPIADGERLLDRIGVLLCAGRAAGVPILFVQDCGRIGGAYEAGTPHWEIHPAIAPLPGEPVVQKHHASAFVDTDLLAHLADRGVQSVAVCGQQSEGCLLQTCRGALSAGLGLVVVGDAHSTLEGAEETAAAIIDRVNATLSAAGARIAETAEVLARWAPVDSSGVHCATDQRQRRRGIE